MFKSLLGLAAVASLAAAQDININQYGSTAMQVQFNGNSGGFKIFLNANGSNVFYNVKYMGLQEVTSTGGTPTGCTGQKCQMSLGNNIAWAATSGTVPGSNNAAVAWNGVTGTYSTTVQGVSQNFPVGVVITNMMYAQNVVINTASNVTLNVIANTLKIAVNVTGWTASAPGNMLQLWVKISSNQNENLNPAIQPYGNNAQKVYLSANGAYSAQIVFENSAYLVNSAGAYISYPVTLAGSSSQNQNYINLPINTAGDQIWWDPTVMTVPNSAFTRALSFAAVVVALLAGVVTLF